jgi:hypothetical protein
MIHIYYRDCQFNKANNLRPSYFSYEKCFKSLLDTLDDRVSLTIMFDGDPLDKNHYITKYINYKNGYNIIPIKAGGDFESNTKTFEYIKQQNNLKQNELIMVQENDYLFRNGWVDAIYDVYNRNINYNMDNSYVSLYDHSDKLTRNVPGQENNEWGMYANLKSQVYLSKYGYVRETPSTCASFILKKSLLDKDINVHLSGKADNTRFGILTKEPFNRKVLSFMPGYSSHMHSYYLSPFIDWRLLSDSVII